MVSLLNFRLRTLFATGIFLVSFLSVNLYAAPAGTAKGPSPQRAPQAKSPSAQAQATLDQAKRQLDADQPEAAATILRKFLAASPSPEYLDDAYLLMAASMYGMKEYGEASKYLAQLFGEFPESELIDRGKLLLAKTHAKAGNVDLALPLLSEVRSLSPDAATKREALRLTGDFQIQRRDFLRAIQAWLEEMSLEPEDQPHEAEQRIRTLVQEQLEKPALIKVRDAYPRAFPGDLALIKLIELNQAADEDHLIERNIKLFLNRFPSHPYAAKAMEQQAAVRTKMKSHPYSIAAVGEDGGVRNRGAQRHPVGARADQGRSGGTFGRTDREGYRIRSRGLS